MTRKELFVKRLQHILNMPEDWTPTVDDRPLDEKEKEAFLTGIEYALELWNSKDIGD